MKMRMIGLHDVWPLGKHHKSLNSTHVGAARAVEIAGNEDGTSTTGACQTPTPAIQIRS